MSFIGAFRAANFGRISMVLRAGVDGQVLDFWYARWVVVWPGEEKRH
jgi:hypothetical protein